MLDMTLKKTGTLLIHEGHISVSGFEAAGASCRETAALAVLWAIGLLQRELTELVGQPGGGAVSIDLPPAVHAALGLPEPWDEEEDVNDD
ncbi:hypothetical protein ACLD0W_12825 [Alloalcanivorax sp. C16-1]|uniref:hypothetical protein n=1 Tax=Alloalcanivorax sp. C16-1 TaxID=3390051 RepID=UPI003970CD3E